MIPFVLWWPYHHIVRYTFHYPVTKTRNRKGAVKLRAVDYAERQGYMKGLVRRIIHDPGRGAPLCEVVFHDPYRFKLKKERWTAVEGLHTGQFVYCGSKAQLAVEAPTYQRVSLETTPRPELQLARTRSKLPSLRMRLRCFMSESIEALTAGY